MEFIKNFIKTKQAKIGITAVCIIAILAGAFFMHPEPKNNTEYNAFGFLSADKSTSIENISEPISDNFKPSESTPNNLKPTGSTSSELNSKNYGETSSPSNKQTQAVTSASVNNKYDTDSVPQGKPNPVEPGNIPVDNNKKLTCTLSIRCDTILKNMDMFNKDKLGVLPKDGVILQTITVTFSEGESVFNILKRVTREKRIHMEFKFTPIYNSAYIQGIHNLYEFDCGNLSGWMYKVNDWFPNYGCSRYMLKDGDVIEWIYTCDLGKDIGGGHSAGQGGN